MGILPEQTITQLTMSVNEKDVENSYRQYFTRKISDMIFTSPFGCDGLGESKSQKLRVLCEFKDDLDLSTKSGQVKVLAQTVYYIKKFEISGIILPTVVFVGDKNECFVIHVNDLFKYLSMDLDWSTAPSNAHKNLELVNEMLSDENINPHVFSIHNIDDSLQKVKDLTDGVTRLIPITPHNLTEVFSYFEKNVLAKNSLNTNQLANLFTQILINPDDNYLHPVKKRKTIVTKSFNDVPIKSRESFTSFFSHFSNDYTPRQKEDLTAVVDRLIQDVTRRKQGEFFTPTIWVDKAHEYIASVYGEDWKEKYVVWDPAWGTGNLTRDYKFKELYVSTLNYSDIQTAEQMGYNPEAVKFQFDFLNDDYDFLPKGLRDVIESGEEIIILMNPPYGRANGNSKVGTILKGGTTTIVSERMKTNNLGGSSSQLYSQFLYRLVELNIGNICVFAKSLYKTSSTYENFRKIFYSMYKFEKGLLFKCSEFADVSDNWAIDFSIYSKGETINDNVMDVLNNNGNGTISKVSEKKLISTDNKISMSDWCKNEKTKINDTPKLSSSLSLKETEYGFGLCENSFSTLVSNANNVAKNANSVYFINGGVGENVGKIYVNKDTFLKSCCIFSARKTIKGDWLNDKDEYLKPNEEHEQYPQFTNDSVVYSLFNNSSQQSSLRQVTYKNQLWDIKNEFFWMSKDEMMELANNNNYNELYNDVRTDKNRYVYNLLFGKQNIYEQLSPDAKLVLDNATELVRMSMTMRSHFADNHNHLNSWDAGYAQLKLVWKEYFPEQFKEFRQSYKNLENRMRPLVYELGFLL
jgi:hypothetical protein